MLKEVEMIKSGKKLKDYIAEDIRFKLVINGKSFTFRISPMLKEEFVIGYCFGEGLIEDLEDFKEIKIEKNVAKVKINIKKRKLSKINSDLVVSYKEIIESMERLKNESETWRKTGGVHISAIVSGEEFILVEDINRHACIDKLLGIALKRSLKFSNSYVVCSGRLSEGRVKKIIMAGVPIIASMAAPLFSSIECAKKYGLTLAGFVRNGKINIYSCPERIRNEV